MQINGKELNKVLHEIPATITALIEVEKRFANIRELLIKAIDHKEKKDE